MIRSSAFILLTVFSFSALGSRVLEIEEFYRSKVSEMLQTRFPQTPYSVFVSIDTGQPDSLRRDLRGKSEQTKLPYWYDEDSEKIDLWERMDVPLGVLIKQVRSVTVSLKVDATLNEAELEDLKDNLAKHLKLDASSDRIEITRMNWTDQDRYRNLKWVGGSIAIGMMLLLISGWLVSKIAIARLVKGLTKPISEIGQSTQKFANQALNLASDLNGSQNRKERNFNSENADSVQLPADINLVETREAALELLERNQGFFDGPDADFMDFLERHGEKDPVTMGSILAELPKESLRNLFQFGVGSWWYKAIAHPAPLTIHSLSLLSEIDRLRLRRHFSNRTQGIEKNEYRQFALILNRLKKDVLVDILSGNSLDKVGPVLNLVPKETSLAVAKTLFPGQWAIFLSPTQAKDWVLDPNFLKTIENKALEVSPLRGNEEIAGFFEDLDLVRYLDTASPRDERDFYTVLPKNSRIVKERHPFYSILDASDDHIKVISGLFSPREWAIGLAGCDPSEKRHILEKFPERLRQQVIEVIKKTISSDIDDVQVSAIRRDIVSAFVNEASRAQFNVDEILNDSKESSEHHENKAA